LIAWWVHAAALWIWHAPGLFQLTLVNETVHAAQHLSFLGSALLFWWSLFYVRGQTGYGAGVLYIFTTAVHTSILGALLTFSTRIWFPAYARSARAWGLTPLEDQQIGGLIMWVPAGIIYVAVALFLFAAWLRESDTRTAETRYVE
jgi:cytochrome c oxidase assembly factor CtaG